MALRHTGELYNGDRKRRGTGPRRGHDAMRPSLMLSFRGRRVQHIAAGPSHALAVTCRAPSFMTTRPEKKIRWHAEQGRGAMAVDNNGCTFKKWRRPLAGARFRPPSFQFGFAPGERLAQELSDMKARHFKPKEIEFGKIPVLPPPKSKEEKRRRQIVSWRSVSSSSLAASIQKSSNI